jgi:hypothetical protein
VLLSEKYNGYCGCIWEYNPSCGRRRLFFCRGTFTHADVFEISNLVNVELGGFGLVD